MPTNRRPQSDTADSPTQARSAASAAADKLKINGAPVTLESNVKSVSNAAMPKPLPPIQPPKQTKPRSEPVIRTLDAADSGGAVQNSQPTPRRTSSTTTRAKSKPVYSDPYAEREAPPPARATAATRSRSAPPARRAASVPGGQVAPGINHEIVGLILVGLAVLLLWSFFATDGFIASFFGANLKHFFGIGAIIVPFFVGFIGYTFFIEGITKQERIQQSRLVGAAMAVVAFLGFVHLFTDDPQRLAEHDGGGGLLGYGVSRVLSGPLQGFGAGVVLVILMLAGLMFALNVTLTDAWGSVQALYLQLRENAGRREVEFEDDGEEDDESPFTADGRNRVFQQASTFSPPVAARRAAIIPPDDFDAPPAPVATKRAPVTPPDNFDTPPLNTPPAPKILGDVPVPKAPVINGINTAPGKRSAPPPQIIEPSQPPPSQPPPEWRLPRISLLTSLEDKGISATDLAVRDAELTKRGKLIEETLFSFGVEAYVREINTGPTVTQYAIEPGVGVKVARITALANDLALALAAPTIRIEAPVPGQQRVGIEVPNKKSTTVNLRELMEGEEFTNFRGKLRIALGQDVAGQPIVTDLAKMPHLLIAGSTGSGKSVCINALVACLLFQYRPTDLQFVMIDPKMVELSTFNGIPHLKFPVVTQIDQDKEEEERERKFGAKPSSAGMAHLGASEPGDITPTVMSVLKWSTREMEKRYKLLSRTGHRNIEAYNKVALPGTGLERLPYLVIMIDELADLMMAAPDEVEMQICRLAQKGRACGIHLILATQRPSVDVVTGLIKANFPTRIAFAVTSQIDSRVVLDTPGAEKLLGRGDMLFVPPDASKPSRVQGTYVSDDEIDSVVKYWRDQNKFATSQKGDFVQPQMFELQEIERERLASEDETDELFETALEVVREARTASTSLLQRRLRVGYNRAARLIDQLEAAGVIGPADGGRPRPVRFEAEDLPPTQDSADFDTPPVAVPQRMSFSAGDFADNQPRRTFTGMKPDYSGGVDDARGFDAAPPGPPVNYAGRDDGSFGRAARPQPTAPRSPERRPSFDNDGFPPL